MNVTVQGPLPTDCTQLGLTITCVHPAAAAPVAVNGKLDYPITIIPKDGNPVIATALTTPIPGEISTADNGPSSTVSQNPLTPNLVLTVTGPAPVLSLGAISQITATVTNTGTAPANGPITTTIDVPANVTVQGPLPATCTQVGLEITCISPAGTPLPVAGVLNYPINIIPIDGSPVSVSASTALIQGESDTSDNGPESTTPVTPLTPNLVLTVTGPSPVLAVGASSLITPTVTNTGTAPAAGPFTTTVSVPANVTVGTLPTGCTQTGLTITCLSNGPLPIGGSLSYPIPVTPKDATPVSVAAQTAVVPGDAPADNGPVSTPLATPLTPNLVTGLTGPTPVLSVGQPSVVTALVTNTGTAPAIGIITTTIQVPANATVGPLPVGCTQNVLVITCASNGAPLPVGSSLSYPITITPTDETPMSVSANTAPIPGDPPADNGPVSTPLATPLSPNLVTTVTGPAPVLAVGAPSQITATVTNTGTAPANGPITTTLTVPASVVVGTLPTSCTQNALVITCVAPGPLAPGASADFPITVTPKDGTPVVVSAQTTPLPIESSVLDNGPVSTVSQSPLTPNLVATITGPAPVLVVNQTSQITATVANAGTAPAAGPITTTIAVPGNVTVGTLPAGCTLSGLAITCIDAGPLAPGAKLDHVIPMTPRDTSPVQVSTWVAPLAGESNPSDNGPANTAPQVALAPNLVTTVSGPAPALVVGYPSQITAAVANTGTAPAGGPITTTINVPANVIVGTLPAGCTLSGLAVTCVSTGPVPVGGLVDYVIPFLPEDTKLVVLSAQTAPIAGESSVLDNGPASTTPQTPLVANLTTTITGPAPVLVVGQPSLITATVTSNGTAPANRPITTTISVPANVTVGTLPAGCTQSGQTITCVSAGPLPAGSSLNYPIAITPKDTTPVNVSAQTTPVQGETNTGDNGPVSTGPKTPLADADGDGNPDIADLDDDNDGILDTVEGDGAVDTDGDGVPDSRDLDSDGDGVNDVREAGGSDANGDGFADGAVDANGVPTSAKGGLIPPDTDGDGKADFRDLDSDGDGVNDVTESGGSDANGDGKADGTDADGDGIASSADGSPATYGDNDTKPLADTDGDGIPDVRDLDSDNDGINDVREGGGTDADGDGKADGTDPDGDGIASSADGNPVGFGDGGDPTLPDTDGDGVPNIKDLDSDNDGLNDVIENGGTDANGDGKADGADPDGDGIPASADGAPAAFGDGSDPALRDSDGDGVPDVKDLDSDNDGLNDVIENGGTDANGDGKADGADPDGDGIPASADGAPTAFGDAKDPLPLDTDGDGVPNARDLDSDNDGLNDVAENGGTDANGDGMADGADPDGDGIPASADGAPASYGDDKDPTPVDSDGDGVPNFRDLDSDNDGINDVVEGGNAANDANGDGLADGADTDGDGIPNSVDGSPAFGDAGSPALPNGDGDTLPDYVDPNGPVFTGADPDGDGIPSPIDGASDQWGNAPRNTIGDYVWFDANKDGQQNPGELGVSGIAVKLYVNGSVFLTATTNASGYYSFTNAVGALLAQANAPAKLDPNGSYTVSFTAPVGFVWTTKNKGNTATDSDVNSNGVASVALTSGELTGNVDAGLVTMLAISKSGRGSGQNGGIGKDRLITYTLKVTNTGVIAINNVIVKDPLPGTQIYSGRSTPAPDSTNPLRWNLGTLNAGEVKTIVFVVQALVNTGALTNTVYVDGPLGNAPEPVVLTQDTANVPFAPDAVALMRFDATRTSNGVKVAWQTSSEVNTFGFALYRSETGNRNAAVLVTSELLPAKGRTGGSYEVVDETAQAGKAYHYWLIESETTGRVNEYGPTQVGDATQQAVLVLQPSTAVQAGGVAVANVPVGVAEPLTVLSKRVMAEAQMQSVNAVTQQAATGNRAPLAGNTQPVSPEPIVVNVPAVARKVVEPTKLEATVQTQSGSQALAASDSQSLAQANTNASSATQAGEPVPAAHVNAVVQPSNVNGADTKQAGLWQPWMLGLVLTTLLGALGAASFVIIRRKRE